MFALESTPKSVVNSSDAVSPTADDPFLAIMVHAHNADRLRAAMTVWATKACVPSPQGAGCLRIEFLYVTSQNIPDMPQPSLKIDATMRDGRKLEGGEKTMQALEVLVQLYPRATWYFKADDDTFIILERLVAAVLKRNSDSFTMFGALVHRGVFTSGGAGYGFSGVALRGLMPWSHMCHEYRQTFMEDVMMCLCWRKIYPDQPIVDEPGMWADRPRFMIGWYATADVKASRMLAPVISYHHEDPARMHRMASPVYPRQTIIQVWVRSDTFDSSSHPHGALVEHCKDIFLSAGWNYQLWPMDRFRWSHIWYMMHSLSDESRERMAGIDAVYEEGGIWISASTRCTPETPLALASQLRAHSNLLEYPTEPLPGLARPETAEGKCAVFVQGRGQHEVVGRSASFQVDKPAVNAQAIACTQYSLTATRLLLSTAVGLFAQNSTGNYPGALQIPVKLSEYDLARPAPLAASERLASAVFWTSVVHAQAGGGSGMHFDLVPIDGTPLQSILTPASPW